MAKFVSLDRLSAFLAQIKTLLTKKSDVGHTHTKSEVGLGNVDNTADVSKSVASAAKLTTARTIGISNGAIGTATSFNGTGNISIPITSMKEAYLEWGGKNISGDVSPVDAAMNETMAANRLSYMSPDAITVEYSTDGGVTWADYEATDAQKTNLVTNTSSVYNFYFGKNATASTDNQLRVTINIKAANIRFRLRKALIWLSISGGTLRLDVESSMIGAPTTFTSLATDIPVSGWSGWNSIALGSFYFGGNDTQTSQRYAIRFTFRATAIDETYGNAYIRRIFMHGEMMGASTHSMQTSNRMYTIDANKQSTFANNVKAPTFIGALSGNATTSTKATQDSSGQQINTTYIKGLSVSGKTMTVTKGNGSTSELTLPGGESYDTGTETTAGITKLYTGTGTATDGTMTQAAITELVGDVESLLAAI